MCLRKKTPPLFPGLITWSNVLSILSCSFCGTRGSSLCSWQPHPSCRAYWNPPLLFFAPHGEQSALQQKKRGSSSQRSLCHSSSKLPGRAWGHRGHDKGHNESLTWHLCSVNAALDLAPSSIFMGGVQTEAQEWEAGIRKRKIMDCWDMPDAETLRRKETEAFKLYSCDSEELWVDSGRQEGYWHFHPFVSISTLHPVYPILPILPISGGAVREQCGYLCLARFTGVQERQPESYFTKP